MGCMDQNALNFNPHATVNTQCCYPPNRYVKVEMAESVFRENFWTMEVGGKMAGVGLPLIGSDEVCVPQDSCVKVTTYDEACDGMMVGGGGVTISSRVVVDGTVHTTVDAEGNFECSKRTQFGTCPIGLHGQARRQLQPTGYRGRQHLRVSVVQRGRARRCCRHQVRREPEGHFVEAHR